MFTVATWNLENLFRPGEEGGPSSQQVYDAKLAALAATINDVAPDVLGVQEVGSPAALEDLRLRLDGAWESPVFGEPGDRPIRVAFLSRHPLLDVTGVHAFPAGTDPVKTEDDGTVKSAMSRGAVHVRVSAGATDVELVVCHLKSKLLHFPSPPGHPAGGFATHDEGVRARYAGYALALRAAEAITVRAHVTNRLDGHGQQRPLIVMGDLNDEPLAATTQILLGPPGSEIGTGGFEHPDQGDGQRLWNLAAMIPEQRRFTRRFEGRGELIDHLLVSNALVHHVDSVDTTSDVPTITADPAARKDAPGSDHAMVFARMSLG